MTKVNCSGNNCGVNSTISPQENSFISSSETLPPLLEGKTFNSLPTTSPLLATVKNVLGNRDKGSQALDIIERFAREHVYEGNIDAEMLKVRKIFADYFSDPSDQGYVSKVESELQEWQGDDVVKLKALLKSSDCVDGTLVRAFGKINNNWSFMSMLTAGLALLPGISALNLGPCSRINKLRINDTPYNPFEQRQLLDFQTEEACSSILEHGDPKHHTYNLAPNLRAKNIAGFYRYYQEIIDIKTEMNGGLVAKTSVEKFVRHETKHAEQSKFNEKYFTLNQGAYSSRLLSPCVSWTPDLETECENRISRVYVHLYYQNPLDKDEEQWNSQNPLSKETLEKLDAFALKASGVKFLTLARTMDEVEEYKKLGADVQASLMDDGYFGVITTIPDDPKLARNVLMGCLKKIARVLYSDYEKPKKNSLDSSDLGPMMAAEIEANLVGELGSVLTRELFKIFDPRLAELLQTRDDLAHSGNIYDIYEQLHYQNSLSKKTLEKLDAFALKASGIKFLEIFDTERDVKKYKKLGANVKVNRLNGHFEVTTTIPDNPKLARKVLMGCLKKIASEISNVVYSEYEIEMDKEGMSDLETMFAKETEARLVGLLGSDLTQELFKILDPQLAELP